MKYPLRAPALKFIAVCLTLVGLIGCSSQPKTIPPAPVHEPASQSSAKTTSSPQSKTQSRPPKTEFQRPAIEKQAPVDTATGDYQTILASIRHWQVQGKLGIRLPDNSGSLYYNWMQEPHRYAIHLSGPLGQGATWIRGNDSQVSITSGDKLPVFADTPEQLMQETLGWSLPVEELYYWGRGLVSPESPVTTQERDRDGRLVSLQQSGWQVSYQRYKSFSGWMLPQKMIAERRGIRLTLIMKNWKIY
ncbi:MAG: hypothetical protein AseanaTS_16020 [Candidatus Pelagadaptatus aseana]|uniref:lipoprotein insertase outer membrane protein LolB n=1 Tax=Candidatus Pelagadaptatus aseana TaxID=3120508 RepID=UPI0039B2B49B